MNLQNVPYDWLILLATVWTVLKALKWWRAPRKAVEAFNDGDYYQIFITERNVRFAAEHFRRKLAANAKYDYEATVMILWFIRHLTFYKKIDPLDYQSLRNLLTRSCDLCTPFQIIRLREVAIGINSYNLWRDENWNKLLERLKNLLSIHTLEAESKLREVLQQLKPHLPLLRVEKPSIFDSLVGMASEHAHSGLLSDLFGGRGNIPPSIAENAIVHFRRRQDREKLNDLLHLLVAANNVPEIRRLAEETPDPEVRKDCERFLKSMGETLSNDPSSPAENATENAQ